MLGTGAVLPSALPSLLIEQFRRVLSLFVKFGDAGSFYYANVPGFDAITAALIWLGMGAALARPRRFYEMTALIVFGCGWVFYRAAFSRSTRLASAC